MRMMKKLMIKMMKMMKMPETGGSIASERCAVDDIDSVEGERSNDDYHHHYYLLNIKYRTYLSHAYDEICGVGGHLGRAASWHWS